MSQPLQNKLSFSYDARAKTSFIKGLSHLREGETERALRCFRAAMECQPFNIKYQLLAAWVTFLRSPNKKSRRRWRIICKQLALEVIAEENTFAKAYCILSHIYWFEHNVSEALELFKKAVDLDRSDPELWRNLFPKTSKAYALQAVGD